jgi:acetyl esterase/lipase
MPNHPGPAERAYGGRPPGMGEVVFKLVWSVPTQLIPCCLALLVVMPATIIRRLVNGPKCPTWPIWLELLVAATRTATWASRTDIFQLQYIASRLSTRMSATTTTNNNNTPPPISSSPSDKGGGLHIELVRTDRVCGEWLRPAAVAYSEPSTADGNRCCLLYVHGGAYFMGDSVLNRPVASKLAAASQVAVFSMDYRLAPQHPYPAALEDAIAAFTYLTDECGYVVVALSLEAVLALGMIEEHACCVSHHASTSIACLVVWWGRESCALRIAAREHLHHTPRLTASFNPLLCRYRPEQIVVCGESAGGGLSMALILWLTQQQRPVPCGWVGMSPWLDLECTSDSWERNAEVRWSVLARILQNASKH